MLAAALLGQQQPRRIEQVSAHPFGGRGGVAVAQRRDDPDVLGVDRAQVATAPDRRGPAEADQVAQLADDRGQAAIAGRHQDDLVEAGVMGHEGTLVAGVGEGVHGVQLARQGIEIVVAEQRAGAIGGGHLEQQAQREDLLEVVRGGLQHAHASVALEAHHAVALQEQQRLAHRRARDAEALGQTGHGIALARRQSPVDYGGANGVVRVRGQRRAVERQALQRALSVGSVGRAQP